MLCIFINVSLSELFDMRTTKIVNNYEMTVESNVGTFVKLESLAKQSWARSQVILSYSRQPSAMVASSIMTGNHTH